MIEALDYSEKDTVLEIPRGSVPLYFILTTIFYLTFLHIQHRFILLYHVLGQVWSIIDHRYGQQQVSIPIQNWGTSLSKRP